MQFSEQWLRQWVNPSVNTQQLSEQLTMAGLEVDSIELAAPEFNNVIIGHVTACEQHPDADRLKVCTVDVGDGTPRNIVCGGKNVRQGLKVAASIIGAVLPGGFKIKKSKLRGVVSEGMICSATELGLAESDAGIMELPDDAPIGQDVREYFNLNDSVIDVDLTPNRGDCASVQGVARDVAALNNAALTPIEIKTNQVSIEDTRNVTLSSPKSCARYIGRVIKGIDATAQTPLWLSERLRRSGIRSIHPVVDVGNYVMLELGQPMHAFDLSKIDGTINVRHAQMGEKLLLLDGQELELNQTDLVIADDSKPLALAGVMGGLDSGVTLNTKDVFLESAYFEAVGIAKTARGHRINSDSSYRYERGVDFELQINAVERFTEILLEVVGGQAGPLTHEVSDEYLPQRNSIDLRRARISKILGIELTDQRIEQILSDLNMSVISNDQGWQVTPPSYRYDIEIEIDLIEELVRINGYDQVPVTYPVGEFIANLQPETELSDRQVKAFWVDKGYCETLSYSFVEENDEIMLSGNKIVRKLINPISKDMAVMRSTIWTGLLQTLRYNQDHQQSRVRLFEIGLCFNDTPQGLAQPEKIAVLLTGSQLPEQWSADSDASDYYTLKGEVEQLLQLTHNIDEFQFVAGEHVALHPGKSAQLRRGTTVIGHIGELHPSIQAKLQLKQKVYLFEADFSTLRQTSVAKYQRISKFPCVRRDLAITIAEDIPYGEIKKTIVDQGGQLLQNVTLFDVYRGQGIAPGAKSIAMALAFQHEDRTLVDEEVNKVFDKLINVLQEQFSAQLRI